MLYGLQTRMNNESKTFEDDDVWNILNLLYSRFFDYDHEIQNSGVRFSRNRYYQNFQKFGNGLLLPRDHPKFGKCLTFRYTDRLRKNGLYYFHTYRYSHSQKKSKKGTVLCGKFFKARA